MTYYQRHSNHHIARAWRALIVAGAAISPLIAAVHDPWIILSVAGTSFFGYLAVSYGVGGVSNDPPRSTPTDAH